MSDRNPPDVQIRVDLGVQLILDDAETRLSPLQQAYLLLLAHAGTRGFLRPEAFRLLWDEEDSTAARHRLRQLNYGLKRRAGRSLVDTEGALVRLAPGISVVWMEAPSWKGVPIPTSAFGDRILEIYDERALERERAAVHGLNSARLSDAPELLLQALEDEGQSSGSWKDGLWALLRTGRIREAEYELQRVFGDDLPTEALSAIRRLASEATELLSVASSGGRTAVPLLGRTEEVRRLQALLRQGAASILITGDHGVGRSRLLGHAVASLLSDDDESVILSANGQASERHLPFGGLGQLLADEVLSQAHQELDQPHHEVLSRALPVHFDSRGPHPLAPLGGPGSYLRVARALEALFKRAFGRADVLLCIDDLGDFDRSSLEVVTFLLQHDIARLLGTWCTEDPGAQNDLIFRFQELDADLVPVGDLRIDDAATFARSISPDLEDRAAEEIARLSGGRPGRMVEIVNALGDSHLPRNDGPGLDAILRKRVRELDPAEQDVLVFLSVNQGRLGLETLGRLLDTGVLATAGYARSLEATGLVRLEGERTLVAPSLLKDFVLRELPSTTRNDTHRLLADCMEAAGSQDYGALGHHRLSAGRPLEASDWFRKAAIEAKERTAYAEAVVFIEKCLAASDELDPELASDLGRLYFGLGEFQRAIQSYERARGEFKARANEAAALEVSIDEATVMLEAGEATSELFAHSKALLTEARSLQQPHLIAQAIDLWLQIADYSHDALEVVNAHQTLLKELKSSPSPDAFWLTGARLIYLGDPSIGLRLAKKAYLRSRGEPIGRLKALNRVILGLYTAGRADTWVARALTTAAETLGAGTGDFPTKFNLFANLGLWHLDTGKWPEAEKYLNRAEELIAGRNPNERQLLATNRAIMGLRRRDMEAVREQLQILANLPMPTRRTVRLLGASIRVFLALEEGQIRQAREAAELLKDVKFDFPFSSNHSLIPEALAELLRREGRKAEAIELLEGALTGMTPFNAPARIWLNRRLASLQSRS